MFFLLLNNTTFVRLEINIKIIMQLNDQNVLQYFNINRYKNWNQRESKYIEYLLNRFNDFSTNTIYDKCKEALYRLKHNIELCPKCELCGKSLKYLVNAKFYESACCDEHKKILANIRLSRTSQQLYGVNRPSQSKIVKEKQKETNIKKYGTISVLQNDNIKEKTKQTLLIKYNVENIAQSVYWKNAVNKTSQQKYGTLYPNQSNIVKEKIKSSCLMHFGVDNYLKTQKARNNAKSKETINKIIVTKRKNHTFNTSKIEIDTYSILKEKYPDVIYQYKDKDRYPFVCDFYIPSLDLYIECNYHWTHGEKPYEGTIDDNKKLQEWKNKNTKYYNNAITTWTIRDVNKRNMAKQNNLNYLEVWNINEIKLFIENN